MCDNILRIRIYQYIIFKGDYYHNKAKDATVKLQLSKCLTPSEFEQIYKALLLDELFDIIQMDLYNLLK